MALMAASSSCCLAQGYEFAPSEELLVQFLYDKVHYGQDHPGAPIVEYDLYGQEEPWDVWSKFGGGGGGGGNGFDLYFFTKLKKVSPNGCRYNRHVGDGGTWSSARSDLLSTCHVVSRDGAPITLHASKTHLRYEKDGSPHHAAWLLAEFSLGHFNPGSNRFRALDGQFVLCRLRKKYKQAPTAPQVPPPAAAAAGYYNHQRPMSNHVAVRSKKPRKRSRGNTQGSDQNQPNDVVTVTKKPREEPDHAGQESAFNMGSTMLVGTDTDQECFYATAVSPGLGTTSSSVTLLDHGISESTGSTVRQEDDDDAGMSACSSTAGVQLIPTNSSLTEKTPVSSSSTYDDAFGYDQSFYDWMDQVLNDQDQQDSDCSGSVAMTTDTCIEADPLICSSSDNAFEYESLCSWMDQVFTDQQAAADYSTTDPVEQTPDCTGTTGAVEQTPNCAGTTGAVEQPPNCAGTSVAMITLNNSSTKETPMSSTRGAVKQPPDPTSCYSAAVSKGVDHGITESTGSTVQQEVHDDDATGTSECSSIVGVTLIPPNPSTERTPMSSSPSYNDALGYDQSFYAWMDQVSAVQEDQQSDCTVGAAMTTTNIITSTETTDPLCCSSSCLDDAFEYESFCAWLDQVFTDQQVAEHSTLNNVLVEQPPKNSTGSSVTMTTLNNCSQSRHQ